MPNISLQSYLLHQAKFDEHGRRRESSVASKVSNECENESQLHDDIIEFCKSKGWIALHSRMDKRTTRIKGEFDFTCILPNGIVIFCECKTRLGKLSPEQNALIFWMDHLGHKVHVITEVAQFVNICGNALSEKSTEQSL